MIRVDVSTTTIDNKLLMFYEIDIIFQLEYSLSAEKFNVSIN